jgi:hypothetical protein
MTDETEASFCPKCKEYGDDCGEHLPMYLELVKYWRNRCLTAEAERDGVVKLLEQILQCKNKEIE